MSVFEHALGKPWFYPFDKLHSVLAIYDPPLSAMAS